MSASLDENTQYIDEATGELLSNGYIYIGQDGLDAKLNPISIYSDRNLTTTLSNPQRIGPDGRALNKIWIPGKYSMKVENNRKVQKLNDLSLGEITQEGNTILTNVQGTNSITADAVQTISELSANQVYVFTAVNTNTGAVTLTIDLITTYPIKKRHDIDLQAGDIEANQVVAVIWNATDSVFELMTNSAVGPVTTSNPQTINGVKTFSDGIISDVTGDLTGDITGESAVGGLLKLAEGANIASATDCNIWVNADGNTVHLTGTTAVEDWGTAPQAGVSMRVICDAATPLTYHATTNDLNTNGANYTTAAGDILIIYARSISSYQVTIIRDNGSITGLIQTADIEQTDTSEAVTRACIRADAVGTTEIEDATVTVEKLEASLSPWVELDTQTITSSTTSIDMDGFSASYNVYKVVIWGLGRLGSANTLFMRVKSGGTARTDTFYSVNGGALNIQAGLGTLQVAATDAWDVEVRINNPLNIINNKLLHVKVMETAALTNYHVSYQTETVALSGVQFYTTAGGPFINGGTAKLYGMRE